MKIIQRLTLVGLIICLFFLLGGSIFPLSAKKVSIWYTPGGVTPEAEETWWKETIGLFEKKYPDVDVELVVQSLDTFIPAFQSAAEARRGPDLQYMWEGVWTLENVWAGYLAPVSDYWNIEEIKKTVIGYQSVIWNDKVWMIPGVHGQLESLAFVYNKELYAKVGLDPNKPLKVWDDLLQACAKLKTAGITPMVFGLKDGWGGGWLFSSIGKQTLDSPYEIMAPLLGKAKFTDPKYATWWKKLYELKEKGYFNEDIMSKNLFPSVELVPAGKAAMTFSSMGVMADYLVEKSEQVGVRFLIPKWSDGKMADTTTLITSGGLAITAWSDSKKESADFLKFIHTPKRVNAWYRMTGTLPSSKNIDVDSLAYGWQKEMYRIARTNPGPWLEDWIPTQLDQEGVFAGCQLIFTGGTPEDAAKLMQDVTEKIRTRKPDLVKNYKIWMEMMAVK